MRPVTLDEAAVPGDQPLFVDFVNTLHWYEGAPIELIGSAAELTSWLAEHDLPAHDLAGRLAFVHQLRDAARAVTEALASDQPPPRTAMTALDAALARPVGHLTLVRPDTPEPTLAFETDAADADLLALRVALSLATFLASGDRRRLKLCANPGCGFAFLDTSTNATRRWCYMRYCGNRLKARAFRRRRNRQQPASADAADALTS